MRKTEGAESGGSSAAACEEKDDEEDANAVVDSIKGTGRRRRGWLLDVPGEVDVDADDAGDDDAEKKEGLSQGYMP